MLFRAVILIGAAGAGFLGAIGCAIAAAVFAWKRRRRPAGIAASLALVLAAVGMVAAFQFTAKSFRAVDRFLTEQAANSYDVDTPDAAGNRRGFEHHFGFAPDPGVTRVYYYADEFGADCRYQLSFACDTAVVGRIIAGLGLTEAPGTYRDTGLRPLTDFTWWPPDATAGRTLWVKERPGEYYWQLWYSERDGLAYYQEYSL